MSRNLSIALTIVATFLFLLASVGFWMRTSVLEEETFVDISSNSLSAEDVRLAIAERIVDVALADRPIVRNFVRGPASEVISGILGTSIIGSSIERIARLIFQLLIHHSGERVAINLEPIRDLVVNVINFLAPDGETRIDASQIPDEIVIMEEDDLPPIQNYILALDWIALLLGLASAGLVALVLTKAWHSPARNSYLKWLGGALAIGAFILILITWTAGSTAVLAIDDETGRVIVSRTYDNLIAQLRVQTFGLMVIGIGVWLVGWWLNRETALQPTTEQPSDSDVPSPLNA